MLTLSHYSRVNPSVNQPQLSIKKATVERSLNAESQVDTPEPDWNAGTAAVLSVGIVVVGILSLMKGKNSFKPNSTVPRSIAVLKWEQYSQQHRLRRSNSNA